MDPEQALARIVYCLDRALVGGFKTKAWSGALARVRETDPGELARLAAAGDLKELPGIGDASAKVITEALAGEVPSYLVKLEAETVVPITPEGAADPRRPAGRLPQPLHLERRRRLDRGDGPTARDLGHEYLVLTDHSPRLTIAHGLNRERLLTQLDEIAALNETLAPFRILTGMEVDILEDGALDLDDDLLERLDVVVASVHSKLRSERQKMTERMVLAVASPHVDILGPLHRAPHRQAAAVGLRRRLRVRRLRPVRHRGRDQLPTGAAGSAAGPARRRHRARVLLLDRHRRPRHRPARVAAPRLRPSRRPGRAARAGHQLVVDGRPAGLGGRPVALGLIDDRAERAIQSLTAPSDPGPRSATGGLLAERGAVSEGSARGSCRR